jgi:hypothetical protein
MDKVIQLISNFLYDKNMPFLWKYMFIRWTLMKNQIIQKNSKSWNFETKINKEKDFFKKPFDKIIMCNGFKISSIRCRSHVCEISLSKNMFSCPLKFILIIFRNFWVFGYKPKYLHTFMCGCENSPPPTWIILN